MRSRSLSSRRCGCIDRALWIRERSVLMEHSPARKPRLCDKFFRQWQLLKGDLRASLGSCDYFPEHEPLHRSVLPRGPESKIKENGIIGSVPGNLQGTKRRRIAGRIRIIRDE